MCGNTRSSGCRVDNLIWLEFVNCTQNSCEMCGAKITSENVDQELVDLGYSNELK